MKVFENTVKEAYKPKKEYCEKSSRLALLKEKIISTEINKVLSGKQEETM